MSFSSHACRHAVKPSSSCLVDHVWISDDILAAAFRRFANGHGQRRYESRVPGPLEARRRLAKRRNTALAGVAGSGPMDDMAGLFGRNGRVHMKWSDSPSQKGSMESGGSIFNPFGPPAPPLPFYSENVFPNEAESSRWPAESGENGDVEGEASLDSCLHSCRTVSEVKDAIDRLDIDLRQDPSYSKSIFSHLLSQFIHGKVAFKELSVFLDDPFLNPRGADNYLSIAEYLLSFAIGPARRRAFIDLIVSALELGLVSSSELCAIVKTPPNLVSGETRMERRNAQALTSYYRQMWDAIGRCDVFGHKDLDDETVNAWLKSLEQIDVRDAFQLAKDIAIATQRSDVADSSWVPSFIMRSLEESGDVEHKSRAKHALTILSHCEPDDACKHLISVIEILASSKKTALLGRLRTVLPKLVDVADISTLAKSKAWTQVRSRPFTVPGGTLELQPRHQIILRVWLLRSLSKCFGDSPIYVRKERCTDLPIFRLFNMYEAIQTDFSEQMLSNALRDIRELGLPANGILLVAVEVQARRSVALQLVGKKILTSPSRRILQKLESSQVSFADIFSNIDDYKAARHYFYSDIDAMARGIDVTHPDFVNHAMHIARMGESYDFWTILRLLRAHTPLKIALSMACRPIPDASEMALVRYYPEPRTSQTPDPHAALDMIHRLAASVAWSRNFNPRQSFNITRWLYVFLRKHDAPVRPEFLRAFYHSGVERFRRSGRRVCKTQYGYIMRAIQDYHGPQGDGESVDEDHDDEWTDDWDWRTSEEQAMRF